MNFFAHAVVSGWISAEPAVALGAMLPDLAGMCGARIAAVGDRMLARGVDLHHRTDAAFHRLPGFAMLCAGATRGLRARGLDRGPARGAAHVAVEILLDGALATDPATGAARAAAYARALAAGAADALGGSIAWAPPDREARWHALRAHLAARGAPADSRDPDTAADRVVRALSRRPRLAVPAARVSALRDELARLAPRVDDAAPALMSALRAALTA